MIDLVLTWRILSLSCDSVDAADLVIDVAGAPADGRQYASQRSISHDLR